MSERPRWLTETARSAAADAGGETPSGGRRTSRGPARQAPGRQSPGRRARAAARPQGAAAARRSAVIASRARFERRAAAVRRRPWRLLGVVGGAVLLLAAVVWVVGFSPLLATRTVTVTGLSDPTEQQRVVQASGVSLGTPLARVDTGRAADGVRAIATVATVTVSRSWPSTIVLSVQRKVPVLAVKNPQGQLQVVDSTGVPYDTVSALPPGVAEVNATSEAPDPEGLRAAISILQLLPSAERAQVSGVTVTSADLVTLQLGDVSVVWGGQADGPKKLTVLQALLPSHPAVIDVSAADTPVTR
jgi:cell division protein FtsQ